VFLALAILKNSAAVESRLNIGHCRVSVTNLMIIVFFGLLRIRSSFSTSLCQNQAPLSERTRMNIIGPRIKALRESQGLTQETLTARCNLIGWDISRSTLAKIEAQVRRVTDDEIPLLAEALQVSINQLYK
jgi:hypothetical protein